MSKKIYVNFGVDVDAVAGWLGSYGGEDSPGDISRGLFAERSAFRGWSSCSRSTASRRPGSCPATRSRPFPREIEQVVAAGHEIGIHGYSHENPIAMTREQETAVLDRCIELIESFTGRKPTVTRHRGGSSPRSPTNCWSSAASSTTTRSCTTTSRPTTSVSATPGPRSTTASRPRPG
ncbi:polysaccharide deacetylase family protein [Rhodococcus hoagii]|nr:polysaccharide deacetylase family protein [Prescottella equi]